MLPRLPCQVLEALGIDASLAEELMAAASGPATDASPTSSRSISYDDFCRMLVAKPPPIVTKVRGGGGLAGGLGRGWRPAAGGQRACLQDRVGLCVWPLICKGAGPALGCASRQASARVVPAAPKRHLRGPAQRRRPAAGRIFYPQPQSPRPQRATPFSDPACRRSAAPAP